MLSNGYEMDIILFWSDSQKLILVKDVGMDKLF